MTTAPMPPTTLNDGLVPRHRLAPGCCAVMTPWLRCARPWTSATDFSTRRSTTRTRPRSAGPSGECRARAKIFGLNRPRSQAVPRPRPAIPLGRGQPAPDAPRRARPGARPLAQSEPGPAMSEVVEALLTCPRAGAGPLRGRLPTTPSDCWTKSSRPPASHRASTRSSCTPLSPGPNSWHGTNPSASDPGVGPAGPAWNPGDSDDPLTRIAAAHRISPAQAVLAWHVAAGSSPAQVRGPGPTGGQPRRAPGSPLTPDGVAAITALAAPTADSSTATRDPRRTDTVPVMSPLARDPPRPGPGTAAASSRTRYLALPRRPDGPA